MIFRYTTRDTVRNPSLLRIAPNNSFITKDKKVHKQKLLQSAMKIKESALRENYLLEGSMELEQC